MKIITYQIQLEEPVLVTSLAGDPNTAASFDYLPGSVLRGALISAYMRQNGLKALPNGDPVTQRLFLNGQTRYLNGYLKDREGQRSLPRPLSWQQEKEAQRQALEENPAPVLDFAYEAQEDDPKKQWKPAKKPFFSFVKTKSDTVRWLSPDKVLAVHTQRNPIKGRATTEQGAVYQYEALAAGQRFIAHIVCQDDADAPFFVELLPGAYQLGGSRGAGYGRVTIGQITTTAVREMPGELKLESNGRFLVTCLSDLLLPDEQGQLQADPHLVKRALEKQLHCALTWLGGEKPCAFINGVYIGGFNRKWGLPLPQAKAVSMGSVFVFEPPPHVTIEQLRQLEARGIGLRHAEGFGRIACNWQTEEEWKVEGFIPSSLPETEPLTAAAPESTLLQTMVDRLFRQQLDAQIAAKASEWATKLPVQNSQLSRLRQVVQDELHKRPLADNDSANETMQNGQKRLRKYRDNLQKRDTTRRQFDRAKIDSKPLLDWLEDRLNDAPAIESFIKPASTPVIGNVVGQWTAVMRYEYNLRLVDLTLAYCLKKAKEEK
jgi:CRISPR-associated protein Csx10